MSIFNHFKHLSLTNDQYAALEQVELFLNGSQDIFILQGYAGSGKTTLLKGVVDFLRKREKEYQLMAPTGRAAMVIQQKTGIEATTIHKGIYNFNKLLEVEKNKEKSFKYYFGLRNSLEVHQSVLIVDEASMVSDVYNEGEFFRFGNGYLLSDLIQFADFKHPNTKPKIIFIGDPAQLPPIGMSESPALDLEYLKEKFNLTGSQVVIKEVKRQAADNGILGAATKIRKSLTSGFYNDFDLNENGRDIFNPKYEDFLSTYNSTSGKKIIISYKNKTALALNQRIRHNKFGARDLPIRATDIIINSRNNYNLGIFNGEFGVVSSAELDLIVRPIYLKGKSPILLAWRKVTLVFPSSNNESNIVEGYVLENYLTGEGNYMTPDEQQALYVDFRQRHKKLKPHTEEFKEAIRTDPYFNCILLKYGYAVTCHKAQGGEWDSAFVFWDRANPKGFDFTRKEQGKAGKTNSDFYRWAYTAVTRASKSLYCVNPPNFNSFSEMAFIDMDVQHAIQELTARSVASVDINLDSSLYDVLKRFDLDSAPVSFQNHFIELYHLARKNNIDIVSWERKSYEIWYILERETDSAGFKFWVNGKDEFKTNFQKIPRATSSDALFDEFAKIIGDKPAFNIIRDSVDTISAQVEFDINTEEHFPFLKFLFDRLEKEFERMHIAIRKLQHLSYKERYTITRNTEEAEIDFEYNGKGFLGRVLPLERQCNSQKLLDDVKIIVDKIKNN